ncbi:hypothetical protein, partial [Vibrio cholerae]
VGYFQFSVLFCSINYKKRGRLSVIFHTYQKNPLVKWLDNRNVTKDCLSHNIFPVRDGKDADLLPKQISLKTKRTGRIAQATHSADAA